MSLISLIFSVLLLTSGCSLFILETSLTPDEYLPETTLIVIDSEIFSEIEDSISLYTEDISREGIASSVVLWNPEDSSSDLKTLLQSYHGKAESGFFIGDIPPAWYEQTAFGKYEVFPSDLFYMDLDSTWSDSNGNGFYDSHSDLTVDFYISRVTGSASDINFYFGKLHGYRTASGITPIYSGAFVFKDDDWQNNYRNNNFGLDSIYSTVDLYQDRDNTTKSAYMNRLSGNGAEYVYQWIHAFPPALFVDVGNGYEIIKADDISRINFKGNFYNLFDCEAARFTVNNLAAGYITGTDSCIAVLGSTKTGGVYYPVDFHKALGLGACWGAAYKAWYNTEGKSDDEWYLGIIIMGDPTIRPQNASGADLASGSRSLSAIIPVSEEEKEEMYLKLRDFTPPDDIPAALLSEIEQSRSDYQ